MNTYVYYNIFWACFLGGGCKVRSGVIEMGHAKKAVEFCASIVFGNSVSDWNNSRGDISGDFSGELFCFAGLAIIGDTSFSHDLFKT